MLTIKWGKMSFICVCKIGRFYRNTVRIRYCIRTTYTQDKEEEIFRNHLFTNLNNVLR